jgi:programmed cell death protein 5
MIFVAESEEAVKKRLLRQRMQEQMQAQLHEQAAAHEQQRQMEAALRVISSQILDAKARERLYNLKTVKPEVATQLELYLAQLYQSGQLKGRITDDQLVMILKKLTAKPETKIRRK